MRHAESASSPVVTDDNSDIARALIRRGYFIIPLGIGSKRPLEEGWENKPMSEMHVARFRRHGIGVLCGYGGPYLWAVDLDIYDESVVTRLERFCERFGATVVRQGAAPKLLLVFQTDVPMRKMTSRAYRYGEKMCRIEALGAGQQFAAYGRHPDTGQDYQWLDMLGGLKEIDAKDLPVITAGDVQTLFDEFYTIATEKGWPLWKREKTGNTGVSAQPDEDDPFANARTGEPLETVAVWANTVDCSDYDDWLNLGMALHHEFSDSASEQDALDLWDEISRRFPNYKDHSDLVKRWDSFKGDKPRQVTVRSLAKAWRDANIEVREAAVVAAEPVPAAGKRPRFYPMPASEFAAAPPMSWWVKGVLPQAEVAIIFGESGAGKSFFALDLALHVAIGMPWRGLRVKQGRVVLIAAEGAAGTRQRLQAYREHSGHDLDDIPLAVISDTPNLMEAHHKLIAKQVVETGGAALIVVDTLAASTIGANENSGEDMGKALAACKALHKATGALVILIHHAGKDASKGARGWSGLRAAVDAEIEIARDGDARVATLSKLKDGRDGQQWGFRLEPVTVGVDEDGDPVTSCAVAEAEVPAAGEDGPASRRLGSQARFILAVVQEMCGAGATDFSTDEVLDAVLARLPGGPDPKGRRRWNARRTLEGMSRDGHLSVQDGRISIPEEIEN